MRRLVPALAALLTALSMSVSAQEPRIPRVGFLSPAQSPGSMLVDGFRDGLRELGYTEGQNIHVEYRSAQGQFDRLPGLAAELLRLNVDVIVAVVTQASLAARAATAKIPIVMIGVADPVEVGLVASLAHPGGNVTGTSTLAADVVGKQVELLKEMDPTTSRVGVLWNPANAAFQRLQLRQAEAAGHTSRTELQLFEASAPADFERAFAAMRQSGTRALLILGDPLFTQHRHALAQFVAHDRLAAVSGNREFVEAGGLIAYGPSYFHASKRAAAYVDKILKGAKPADLPVEQPSQFELIVNLKTAKALGIDLPPPLLARADDVIE